MAGYSDGTVIQYHESNWRELHKVKEHQTGISCLVLSPDRKQLAIGDWNGLVTFRDLMSFKVSEQYQHFDSLSGLLWTEDRIVTGSWDGHVRIWNSEMLIGNPDHEFDTRYPVLEMSFLPGERQVALISGRNELTIWELPR